MREQNTGYVFVLKNFLWNTFKFFRFTCIFVEDTNRLLIRGGKEAKGKKAKDICDIYLSSKSFIPSWPQWYHSLYFRAYHAAKGPFIVVKFRQTAVPMLQRKSIGTVNSFWAFSREWTISVKGKYPLKTLIHSSTS